MALKQEFLTDSGLIATEGYFRISGFAWDKTENVLRCGVNVYANEDAADAGKDRIGTFSFDMEMDSDPIVAALYAQLKTTGNFSGAEDV